MRDIGEHLLVFALGVIVVVAAVRWAWTVLVPLAPFMLAAAGVGFVVLTVIRRMRGW